MPSIFPLFTLVRRLVPSSLPSAHTDAIGNSHESTTAHNHTHTDTRVLTLSLALLACGVS